MKSFATFLWRALATVTLMAILFSVVGGVIGYRIGVVYPDYYRLSFDSGKFFEPTEVGLGLGVSQGLGLGLLVGGTVVVISGFFILLTSDHRPKAKPEFVSQTNYSLFILTFRGVIVGAAVAIFWMLLQIVAIFLNGPIPRGASIIATRQLVPWLTLLVFYTGIGALLGFGLSVSNLIKRRKSLGN